MENNMSDTVEIKNPIAIDGDSRVAFELMQTIAHAEEGNSDFNNNPKRYYINLYVDCLEAVRHHKRQS